jgi:hypothetical protein
MGKSIIFTGKYLIIIKKLFILFLLNGVILSAHTKKEDVKSFSLQNGMKVSRIIHQ